MGEIYRLPQVEVIPMDLDEGVPVIDLGYSEEGVLRIGVAKSLSEEQVDELVRRTRSRHWHPRLLSLPAAIAWVRHATHAAGKHTGPTLAAGGVVAAGAMLSLVVVASAPIPPQAAGHAVSRADVPSSVDADPPPVSIPVKPATARPGSVPPTPGGGVSTGGLPASQGPVASALATAGVPGAGSHPFKPARAMVVTSVKSALPLPSHPVRCMVQHVLQGGKLVNVTLCLH